MALQLWAVNPGMTMDVNFGVHVVLPSGQFTYLLPNWICTDVITYAQNAIAQGVPMQLKDPSDYIWDSTVMTKVGFQSILNQCFQQMLVYKARPVDAV